MGLNRCLLACLFALTGVGSAAAMGATRQDPAASHAALNGVGHEGGGGNDATASNHDCTPSESAADGPDAGNDGGGGSTVHPHASRHGSLGWQSLLPGAIQ